MDRTPRVLEDTGIVVQNDESRRRFSACSASRYGAGGTQFSEA
jgi:hypothetical protein